MTCGKHCWERKKKVKLMYVISHSPGLEGLLSVTHYSGVVCQGMGWMQYNPRHLCAIYYKKNILSCFVKIFISVVHIFTPCVRANLGRIHKAIS